MHAPELEEAHEALAELRLGELIEATAVGNRPRQEALSQQLKAHLQVLPISVREGLEARLEATTE